MRLLAFLIIGKLLVWIIQTSGPTRWIWERSKFLNELGSCGFCVGVYVFTFLAWLLGINFLDPDYFPVLSEVITGSLASFGVYLASYGFQAKYGTIQLGDE